MLGGEFAAIRSTAVEQFMASVTKDASGKSFPDLLSLEEQAAEFAQLLERDIVQAFVEMRNQQAKEAKPVCAQCNQPMEWHANTEWKRGTLPGTVSVKDSYAYCRACKTSARPLHRWLGTDRERWSLRVEKVVVDLASDESCQGAVEKLERLYPGTSMDRTVALRFLHKHGERARGFIQEKLTKAIQKTEQEGKATVGVVELEVEYDGGMVPVAKLVPIQLPAGEEPELTPVRKLPKRKKEAYWQEVKAGLVQAPGEVSRLYTVRPTDELEQAFEDLLALACMKGWTEDTNVRGLADGARYIRTRMAETFHACNFRFILDRPHAREHLSEAGEDLASCTGVDAKAWADNAIKKLEVGNVDEVVAELRKAHAESGIDRLRTNANYFERNRDAVAYAEYRERGWSQASSEIESAHRHVVQVRLKIPGAWWHPDNIPNILALRMLKANGWWDEYWSKQREDWMKRAEQFREA